MFSENLYLTSAIAGALYDKYAKDLPIIDFHCHLSPAEICENKRFSNLGELWLAHDHYKWRAMRAYGIDEELISGSAGWAEKFRAFAKILPELAGNPLYIWCALELKRYFDIDAPLCEENTDEIYEKTAAMIIEKNMTPSYFINKSNVEFIATTDDPADDLAYHAKIAANDAYKNCRIVPAFRPDKAMGIERPGFREYISTLEKISGVAISDFGSLINALERRLIAFKAAGSMLNDNALTGFIWTDYTRGQIDGIFKTAIGIAQDAATSVATSAMPGGLSIEDVNRYRSAFLFEMSKLYKKHGFLAQYHVGAYRNANTAMYAAHGPDFGFDGVDEPVSIRSFGKLLDMLYGEDCLPRTVFYPLDINQFEAFATLAAHFNGRGRGWVQLGAPWWFNDQYYGITKQFESVGNVYPTALSIGMLTDSRSFLSYPRHEMYRRALCCYLGSLVDRGEYFSGGESLGRIIRGVCYENAKAYLGIG